jgi:hypothetical protein
MVNPINKRLKLKKNKTDSENFAYGEVQKIPEIYQTSSRLTRGSSDDQVYDD